MENNLLYVNNNTPPKKKLFFIKYIFLAIIVLLGSYFVIANNDIRTFFKERNERAQEREKFVARKAVLDEMYSVESAPEIEQNIESTPSTLNTVTPSGFIVFTGADTRTQNNAPMKIYAIAVSGENKKPEILYPQYANSGMVEYVDNQNPSDFYFIATSSGSIRVEPDRYGIHYVSSKTKGKQALKKAVGRNERNLEWSESSKLLVFNRTKVIDQDYVDFVPIENWEAVIVEPKTSKIISVIDSAIQPKWSPDGKKLLYLKPDGLYAFSLETKTEKKVISIPENGKVLATSMIDVAPNGEYLVWTTPKRGTISVYKISDWTTGDFVATEALGKINVPGTEFYWPKFSPDGQFYALQAIDGEREGGSSRKNPRLQIRSLNDSKVISEYSLKDFNFNKLFTDGWISQKPR